MNALSSAGVDGADGDPDGDGQSNLSEYLAGTDPQNASSVFRLLEATLINQNLRLAWTTVGGRDYAVQTATNVGGSVMTNFFDAAVISVTGTNEGTTNYLHPLPATNRAGFFRVRVVPKPGG